MTKNLLLKNSVHVNLSTILKVGWNDRYVCLSFEQKRKDLLRRVSKDSILQSYSWQLVLIITLFIKYL